MFGFSYLLFMSLDFVRIKHVGASLSEPCIWEPTGSIWKIYKNLGCRSLVFGNLFMGTFLLRTLPVKVCRRFGKHGKTSETGLNPCAWEPLRPSESWENVIDYSAISASGPLLIKEHKTESKTRIQERKALKQAPTCTLRYSHNFFRFNSCRKFLQKKQEPATKTLLR